MKVSVCTYSRMFVPDCLLSGSLPIQMIYHGQFRRYCAPFMHRDFRLASAVLQLFEECPRMTLQTLCRLIQENFEPRNTLLDSSQWEVYLDIATTGQDGTFSLFDQTCPVLNIPTYILASHCICILTECRNDFCSSIVPTNLHRLQGSEFFPTATQILAKINPAMTPNISNKNDRNEVSKRAVEAVSNLVIHKVLGPKNILGDEKFKLMKSSIAYFEGLNKYFRELYNFADMQSKPRKTLKEKSREIGKYFFPFCCDPKLDEAKITAMDTLLKNKLDDFFQFIGDETQNSTKINASKMYLEQVYNDWMISIKASKNLYQYDAESDTFPENGRYQIIMDSNDFFRYDLKTDYNDICYHINGRWKSARHNKMAPTLPDLFSDNNDRQCFAYFICATKTFYPLGTDGILCWLRQYRFMYMKKQIWKSVQHVNPKNKNVMFPV